MKKVKLSDIDIKFDQGKFNWIRDENMMNLLDKAHDGKILCRQAVIKFEAIQPHTNYQPEINKAYNKFFIKKAKEKDWLPLFVYPKGDKFIMSDDYNAYTLYKDYKFDKVPCVVIGEITEMKNIIKVGEPFKLERPDSVICLQ